MAIGEIRIGGRVELRASGDRQKIAGHAAVFDVLSEDLGGFRERIVPGAFARVLTDDVRALFNHDPNYVLGRRGAGTLRLQEDTHGLAYEIDPPDTGWVRDLVMAPLQRGDITQSSFAFAVRADGYEIEVTPDGTVIRTIREFARLYDVSPVTYPAYPTTDAGTRESLLAEYRARLAQESGTGGSDARDQEVAAAARARRIVLAQRIPPVVR